MSLSDLEDSYDYDNYDIGWYYALKGPPLIKKISRLIAAVVQNQVGVLRELLDSRRFYNVRDKQGYSLLQIAILRNNVAVFDYMLSIPDFPLEFVNKKYQTALAVALDCFVCYYVSVMEHFSYELLKKGACTNKLCVSSGSPLHCALIRFYHKTSKLLIEKGFDVNLRNQNGYTPLDLAINSGETEVVTTLLTYGAEPSVRHFESSVSRGAAFEIQEALFLYLYDECSSQELSLDVLLRLAAANSPLFYDIIKCPVEITTLDEAVYPYFRRLCTLSIDCLHIVIKKFGQYINEAFGNIVVSYCKDLIDCHDKAIRLENINVMLESDLRLSVLTFFWSLNGSVIFWDLIWSDLDEAAITQLYCYLLSYGLSVEEFDLQIAYNKFGYCELFKILLHMDVQMGISGSPENDIMPVFVYDVNMNLEQFFKEYSNYKKGSFNELLRYFVHPKLNEICQVNETFNDSSETRFQEIPSLVELARNEFRKFFIKKFEIKTCREFYSRLNWLPISNAHKKIISYETKLY